MAYDCDIYLIVDGVQTYVCSELTTPAETNFHVFEITQAQANELILYAVSCFVVVFLVRSIKSLLI